jgi:hypothetical protein
MSELMNQDVKDILVEDGWTEEYILKFLPALKRIAKIYDELSSTYPESEYEGEEFFSFCANYLWGHAIKEEITSQLPPHKCGSLYKTEAQQASSG